MTERAEFRFWDHWLADGREPHVFGDRIARQPLFQRAQDFLPGTALDGEDEGKHAGLQFQRLKDCRSSLGGGPRHGQGDFHSQGTLALTSRSVR